MPNDSTIIGHDALMAERRVRALQLRAQGLPYRRIAAELGVGVATAHEDIKVCLAELRAQRLELTEGLVDLENERLDVALMAIAQAVLKGDIDAVKAWVRISESRRRLLGLDAATKYNITGTDLDGEIRRELDRLSGRAQSQDAGAPPEDADAAPGE